MGLMMIWLKNKFKICWSFIGSAFRMMKANILMRVCVIWEMLYLRRASPHAILSNRNGFLNLLAYPSHLWMEQGSRLFQGRNIRKEATHLTPSYRRGIRRR